MTNSFDDSDADGWLAGEPCQHTLFAGYDEGLEYRSEAFDNHIEAVLARIEDPDERDEMADGSVDALTDMIEIKDSLKIAIYTGPPGQHGSYVGFAAPELE